jgi:putative phage-type endonuclease
LKTLQIQQNTPDWYAMRRSKIGASDAPSIIGKNPYKTPFMVWREKVLGYETPINDFMQWGIDTEPEAREWISRKHNTKYEATCGEDERKCWRIASLDGWDGKIHVEIKCPTMKRMIQLDKGNIPEYWIIQIQHQLLVNEQEMGYLLGYHPKQQVTIPVYRDEKLIEVIDALEEEFYENYIATKSSPPLSEVDVKRLEDELANSQFMEYMQ